MKILVINGSPKGKYSITLQTFKYLEKIHPEHEFSVLDAGQKIKAFEKDFSAAREEIESAELIIFSYPVYAFIAPCQLHRFIELMKEKGVSTEEKFVTQFSTSKHFYDITAHNYLRDNCFDMDMKYIKGLSADMDDLLSEKGQKEAREFFDFVIWNVKNDFFETAPAKPSEPKKLPVSVPKKAEEKNGDVVIITDCEQENKQLESMINRFSAVFPRKTRVLNIREYPFSGGCLGCFSCAVSGKCVYKDGFDEFLRKEVQTGEAIVVAFSIKDHSMGALFKMYDDRQFCNGHRTVTMGMPFGYLVSGNLSEEENLRMIIEARAQVGGNFLAGVATDEINPDEEIDRLAETLDYAIENKYVPPQNFYGIGGMKIFRDLIWQMQGMMKADHKFYKSHGQYDFPQKKWPRMLAMYAVGAMIGNPKIKAKMGNKMNEGMLMPYKKLLESLDKK